MAFRAGFGVAAACLAGALVATSCDELQDDPPTVLTIDGASSALIDAFCERFADCGCEWLYLGSPEDCRAQVMEEVAGTRMRGEQYGLTFDGTCLGAVVDALDDRGCGQNESSDGEDEEECQRPCYSYHGDAGVGDACSNYGSFSDCAQGLRCDITECFEEPCTGSCTDPCKRADAGESCNNTPCIDTLICDYFNDRCVEGPGPGKTCADYGCAVGSICDFNDNTCKRLGDEGEACVLGQCAAELFCITDPLDPTMGTCRGPADNGEPCMGHLQCKSLNCPAGFCEQKPGKGEGCAGTCESGLECDPETMKCVDAAPAICSENPP